MRVTLRIVVEGQTEETFVNQTLKPYLGGFSVGVSAHVLNKSAKGGYPYRGGLNSYAQAEMDINLWLTHDNSWDARVTTMFDLYRLPKDFPGYCASASHNDPYQRVQALEDALEQKIGNSRFIPYIQLYEFEALLLSDPQKFDSWFFNCPDGITNLVEMVSQFQSPENVNDDDPPSKRINQDLLNYNSWKASAGPIVAEKIGLPTIRAKCAHFANWLAKLENLGR